MRDNRVEKASRLACPEIRGAGYARTDCAAIRRPREPRRPRLGAEVKAKAGGGDWETAQAADIDGSGVVDVEDFISILRKLTF
jgi:hypothetical protein